MTFMYEEKLISAKHIITHLDNDMAMFDTVWGVFDVPTISSNFGIVLASLLSCGVVTVDYFASGKFQLLKENGNGTVSSLMVITLARDLREHKDEAYVKNVFTSSGLASSFVSMMPAGKQTKKAARQHLKKKGLAFLAGSI